MMLALGFRRCLLSVWRSCVLFPVCWVFFFLFVFVVVGFNQKGVLGFKCFCICWDDHMALSFILLIWCIALIFQCFCSKTTLSRYPSFLTSCCIWFGSEDLCICIHEGYNIGLWFSFLLMSEHLVWEWYWLHELGSIFYFFGSVCEGLVLFVL